MSVSGIEKPCEVQCTISRMVGSQGRQSFDGNPTSLEVRDYFSVLLAPWWRWPPLKAEPLVLELKDRRPTLETGTQR
jgi:hypothetical protein